jgi:Ca-activated chloride channel family protein
MKRFLIALGMAWCCAGLAKDAIELRTEADRRHLLYGSPQEVVIKIELTGAAAPTHRRPPLNIAVALDRSGSMTGAKIEKARQAAIMLVDQLGPKDVFSLVAFDGTVDVVVPAQTIEDKEAIKTRIARIQPRGSTAIHAAVETAAEELQKNFSSKRINRVLLLSDGLANVGPSTPQALRRLGERLAQRGISVSTIGVGDDYNEDLMSGLAEASDANYYYVKDTEKLPEIFARELGSLLTVAARDIRIEIICPRGIRPIGFIGRSEQFEDGRAVVVLNSLAAGQNRYLLLRCAADDFGKAATRDLATIKASYVDGTGESRREISGQTVKVSFTDSPAVARASINSAIVAQSEWMFNAVKKDEAIAEADAGRYQAAARKLSEQADKLSAQSPNAPSDLRPQIDAEVQSLREQSRQIAEGQYGQGTRKYLQEQNWNVRNSK